MVVYNYTKEDKLRGNKNAICTRRRHLQLQRI